jgi:heme/copper-type cytochrome/quinol oxidase subunit 2
MKYVILCFLAIIIVLIVIVCSYYSCKYINNTKQKVEDSSIVKLQLKIDSLQTRVKVLDSFAVIQYRNKEHLELKKKKRLLEENQKVKLSKLI